MPRRIQALRHRRFSLVVSAWTLVVLFAGCSTPGPMHVYSTSGNGPAIHDLALEPDSARDIPTFNSPQDEVRGLAYDPFTDHLFLRLAPGNVIRVVDRPARKIKRELTVKNLPAESGGDLAVRPRDGHLFMLIREGNALVETSRMGDFVREIALPESLVGLAYDPGSNQLLGLGADHRTLIQLTPAGREIGRTALERSASGPLGWDTQRRELYARSPGKPGEIAVFNTQGAFLRTVAVPAADRFHDIGPHSLVRMF